MTITCPKCKTRLTLPDEKLKPEGTRFRCSKCGTSLFYKGKRKKAPQENINEQMPSPSSPSMEEPDSPSPVFVPASPQMGKEGLSPTIRADSVDIRPTDAAAEGRKLIDKQEKPQKIEATAVTSAQYIAPVTDDGQKVFPRKAVLAGAAAGILVFVFAAIFFFYSREKTAQDQTHAPGTDKVLPTSSVPVQGTGSLPPAGPPEGAPSGPTHGATVAEGLSFPMTEDKAIEAVKRSEALLRRTTVESIVTKWAEENASKYKVVGWQAKKESEQKYLVSFTAMDGETPKGFYFEVDAQSGAVQNLAQNPEFQKK
jgi:predicted Zn finger-like uncharacterized protein